MHIQCLLFPACRFLNNEFMYIYLYENQMLKSELPTIKSDSLWINYLILCDNIS
jgi:hypothetical protein